ncbi:MAG: hypothetical protein J7L34_00965 [Thermotogaceae bacterium]|nr:hypothetical protein [Thermotogaceae bacterium]
MIWLLIGVISIFWDPGMGYILPLISLYTLGYFWKRNHPALAFLVYFLHHVTALNTGFMELSLMISAFLITEIDSLFINNIIPYGILSIATVFIVVLNYGVVAGIITSFAAIVIYFWRG